LKNEIPINHPSLMVGPQNVQRDPLTQVDNQVSGLRNSELNFTLKMSRWQLAPP
jgi:hypothetical protein